MANHYLETHALGQRLSEISVRLGSTDPKFLFYDMNYLYKMHLE